MRGVVGSRMEVEGGCDDGYWRRYGRCSDGSYFCHGYRGRKINDVQIRVSTYFMSQNVIFSQLFVCEFVCYSCFYDFMSLRSVDGVETVC
jgi:hypothetical protein